MKTLKAVWGRIRERHYSSLLVRFGFPTLVAGLILGVPMLIAGVNLGLFDEPNFWRGFGFPVTFTGLGVASILWGWFRDPVYERRN